MEALAPVFKIRLTDQTPAGSPIPQSRALGRTGRGGPGEAQLAELSPTLPALSQLQFTQEPGRSIQPWWCWSAGVGNRELPVSQKPDLAFKETASEELGPVRLAVRPVPGW